MAPEGLGNVVGMKMLSTVCPDASLSETSWLFSGQSVIRLAARSVSGTRAVGAAGGAVLDVLAGADSVA